MDEEFLVIKDAFVGDRVVAVFGSEKDAVKFIELSILGGSTDSYKIAKTVRIWKR
uniref:Uncharacterized protein n=1 Tax=Dulem virus 42 TaxID=3145760 RepID=A0AAU8B8Q0_9CAUD